MGDESDAPAYLTSFGVALLVGAAWAAALPIDGLPAPIAPLAALIVAAAMLALGAAVKAAGRR